MRGRKHTVDVERLAAWSHYTSYVGVSGLHSENSYSLNAKGARLEREVENIYSTIEKMHRKELMALQRERRDMELSMMAYSEKMRELNKARFSLPTIVTPAAGKKGSKKRFSYPTRNEDDSFMFSSSNASHNSIDSPTCPRGSPVISPINSEGQNNSNGYENETKFLSPSFRFRPYSEKTLHENSAKQRQRKICTISPPNPNDLQQKSRKFSDSVCESINTEIMDDDVSKRSTPNIRDSIVTVASNIEISSFPDIKDEKERIRKSLNKPELRKISKKSKAPRKVSVEAAPEKEQPKKKKTVFSYKQLQKRLELEAQRKQAIAMMRKKMNEEKEDKKHLGSCQSFRYSLAIQELLKKPDPFRVSKKEMVSKVEIENGRIVNTLGPAVLTVVDVDDLRNVRGLRLRKGEAAKSRLLLGDNPKMLRQISGQPTSLRLPPLLQSQKSVNEQTKGEKSHLLARTNSHRRFELPRSSQQSSVNIISAHA